MNLKKRGLGRGLEALLADDSASEEHRPAKDERQGGTRPALASEVDKQTAMVVSFFKSIQKEHHALLEEAESLRQLLDEFGGDVP